MIAIPVATSIESCGFARAYLMGGEGLEKRRLAKVSKNFPLFELQQRRIASSDATHPESYVLALCSPNLFCCLVCPGNSLIVSARLEEIERAARYVRVDDGRVQKPTLDERIQSSYRISNTI